MAGLILLGEWNVNTGTAYVTTAIVVLLISVLFVAALLYTVAIPRSRHSLLRTIQKHKEEKDAAQAKEGGDSQRDHWGNPSLHNPGGTQAPHRPVQCFKAPSAGQSLGFEGCSTGVLVLVLGAALLCAVGVVYLALAAQGRDLYMILAILGGVLLIPLSVFGAWFCLLTFGQGRVELEDKQLVEHGHLGRVRRFGYGQIYAVRRGRYVNRTAILYYAYAEDGQIAGTRIHRTRLVTVHRYAEMRAELRRRIVAPQPTPPIEQRFLIQAILWPLIAFGLLLVVGLAVLLVIAR